MFLSFLILYPWKVIVQLARSLDAINYPLARVFIIWMVGEYCSIGQIIRKSMHIILKYLVRSFTSEEIETKHQIINASIKVHFISIFFLYSTC